MIRYDSIRSLLIPSNGGQFLVPGAAVAEVINYCTPQQLEHAPKWLLGLLDWRKIKIPLISLQEIMHLEPVVAENLRLVVFYGLHQPAVPFYAIIATAMPHTYTVTAEILSSPMAVDKTGILAQLAIVEQMVWLPDLEYLESLLSHAIERELIWQQ
jgi:chemosensory pili system protein ChpC